MKQNMFYKIIMMILSFPNGLKQRMTRLFNVGKGQNKFKYTNRYAWGAKVMASSLVEVVVAMIIIMLTFGILSYFLLHNSKNLFLQKRLRVYCMMQEYITEAKKGTIESESFELEDKNLTIEFSTEHYKNAMDLYLVRVIARDENNNVFMERKEIIRNKSYWK